MDTICTNTQCTGCGVCYNICPQKCIRMTEDKEGFLFPQINVSKCINCGKCRRSCHILNPVPKNRGEFYKAWHKDKEVLKKSSSGGVFTALAEYILKQGGTVVGAEIEQETRELHHIAINSIAELEKIRLSKYYQSDTVGIFSEIKRLLAEGKTVLFCGTACTIAALSMYLGEKNDRLITVDVLCHGVTSKKIIDSYVVSKETKYKKKVRSVYFRVKAGKTGWMQGGGTRMKLVFEDGTSQIMDKELDTFFTAFNNNIILRESCYNCKYCGEERISSFTLADHWGVGENEVSDEQKWYGVSLVLANTPEAKNLLHEIKEDIVIDVTNIELAKKSNRALVEPNDRPHERDKIFSQIEKDGFDETVYQVLKGYYRRAKTRRIVVRLIGEKSYEKVSGIIKGHIGA